MRKFAFHMHLLSWYHLVSNIDFPLCEYIVLLTVLFLITDKRCETSSNRHFVRFHQDAARTTLLREFSGGPESFKDFIIPSNRVWFSFSSGNDYRNWGYKITIRGMGLRMKNDREALNSPLTFHGCQLLDVSCCSHVVW